VPTVNIEDTKNRRIEGVAKRKRSGWRPVRQPGRDRRPPPPALRPACRPSKNRKYKQLMIECCLNLRFLNGLTREARAAGADCSFDSSDLRIFALNRGLVSARRCGSPAITNPALHTTRRRARASQRSLPAGRQYLWPAKCFPTTFSLARNSETVKPARMVVRGSTPR